MSFFEHLITHGLKAAAESLGHRTTTPRDPHARERLIAFAKEHSVPVYLITPRMTAPAGEGFGWAYSMLSFAYVIAGKKGKSFRKCRDGQAGRRLGYARDGGPGCCCQGGTSRMKEDVEASRNLDLSKYRD
ncbi:hypothetical protein ACWEFL_32540 [Streptomyces sp. NPDC004838]